MALSRVLTFLKEETYNYVQSSEKKSVFRQCSEAYRLAQIYRFPPYQYFKHSLYLKSANSDVSAFVPPVLLKRVCDGLNPAEARYRADDKAVFCRLMQEAGLPAARDLFFIHRDGRIESAAKERISYEGIIVALENSGVQNVFVKPVDGVNGLCTYRFEVGASALIGPGGPVSADALHGLLFGLETPSAWHRFVVQPLIEQHPVLYAIDPASVATVRIDTLLEGGLVHMNGAHLRLGTGRSVTANWRYGGLIVAIDPETGHLMGPARTKPKFAKELGGLELDAHPVSGIRFDKVELPHWPILLDVVKRAAHVMRPLGSIGWDVAIGRDGPILIEANHDYDLFMQQDAARGYRSTVLGQLAVKQLSAS